MTVASFPKPQSADAMKPHRNQPFFFVAKRRRFPVRGQRRLRFPKRKTFFQNPKLKRIKHESTSDFQ